ncbi:UNVERIFIED_CONTAM: hypothetical protein Sindi_2977200, partial [Sesamum indicum]
NYIRQLPPLCLLGDFRYSCTESKKRRLPDGTSAFSKDFAELGSMEISSQRLATSPAERIWKDCLSSDCSLQLGNMKLESLVIADQHAAVNMYSGPVHTARHTLGIGFARSIGPMITHDFCVTLVPQRLLVGLLAHTTVRQNIINEMTIGLFFDVNALSFFVEGRPLPPE